MQYDGLKDKIIGRCVKCGGTGVKDTTSTSVSFCDCFKFYLEVNKYYEAGYPLRYVLLRDSWVGNIDNPGPKIFFKQEKTAFDLAMALTEKKNRMVVSSSVKMWGIDDIEKIDGFIIYGLGLETFQNNSVTLHRLLEESRNRNLYGIFSFSIDIDSLKYKYTKSVENLIYELSRS